LKKPQVINSQYKASNLQPKINEEPKTASMIKRQRMRIPESLPMRAKSKHVDKRSKSPEQ